TVGRAVVGVVAVLPPLVCLDDDGLLHEWGHQRSSLNQAWAASAAATEASESCRRRHASATDTHASTYSGRSRLFLASSRSSAAFAAACRASLRGLRRLGGPVVAAAGAQLDAELF